MRYRTKKNRRNLKKHTRRIKRRSSRKFKGGDVTQSFGFPGMSFFSTNEGGVVDTRTGIKGQCYGIGPFKWCKAPTAAPV